MPASGNRTPTSAAEAVVLLAAVLIAIVSARDYAGSWNDGSRLATAEALAEYHVLAIDQSIFAKPLADAGASPYRDTALRQTGTKDKLLIGGRYYSDKPPVLSAVIAAMYECLRATGGLDARLSPALFCYLMTLLTSGGAYVVAVWCVFKMGVNVGLSDTASSALAASLAVSTVAPTYARQVNNHVALLGVAAAIFLTLDSVARRTRSGGSMGELPLALGALAGFGYAVDLAAGAVILLAVPALIIYRGGRLKALLSFVIAALPSIVLHHLLNYLTGGTIVPANTVPAYFQWPGSSFDAASITGVMNWRGAGHAAVYAMALLFGKRGFVFHNLPLVLALGGIVPLLRRPIPERPEVICAGVVCGATWMLYGLLSTNYSGECASIRWFVALLAPAWYVLAIFLRYYPRYWGEFFILSASGAVMGVEMWWAGPWRQYKSPLYWLLVAAALIGCWGWQRAGRRRPVRVVAS